MKDDKDDGWDRREEGESLFEWPLDSTGMRMGAGQLLDSLLDTITRLNRNRAWPLTILPPRPGDVIVDRGRHRPVGRRRLRAGRHGTRILERSTR